MAVSWNRFTGVKPISELSYDQAMEELRGVVDQLERGQLGLERSLELFERGVLLTKVCQDKLHSVEGRIRLLVEQNHPDRQQAAELTDLEVVWIEPKTGGSE